MKVNVFTSYFATYIRILRGKSWLTEDLKKVKYTIKTMVRKIYEYTEKAQLPILKECCFQNDWNYDYVMQLQRDNPVLSQSIRRLLTKKRNNA